MNSREVIRRIEADGWRVARVKGSHHVYKHPEKSGLVVVKHPAKDYPVGTLKSMEQQAGVKLT